MLYAIPSSTIVKLEQLISNLLRRWLGLPLKAVPKIGLYITQTPCWWEDRWCRHTRQDRNGLWDKQRNKPKIISSTN